VRFSSLISGLRLQQRHEQRIPSITATDVERIVRRDFPDEQFDIVMSVLTEYGTEKWHREPSRVQLAAMKLADGDVNALRRHIDTAKQDYRDVLAAAEYPEYSKKMFRVRELPSREQNRIVDDDWRQYETWLRK
jgi:hypothetical protein